MNIKLLFEVKGARINEARDDNKQSIQLQTFSIDKESGELKKFTLKINNENIDEDTLHKLIGKTVFCDTDTHNLGEYGDSFSKTYGADSYTISDKKVNGIEINKEIILESVQSVIWKENKNDKTKSKTVIQAVVIDGMNMDLISIGIKIADEKVYKKLLDLKGKKVLVKNLNEFKDTKNFKTYLSSEVMPEILK